MGSKQFAHDGPGRGAIRVAHAEVHDVLLLGAQSRFHLVGHREHIRRQLLNTVKLVRRDHCTSLRLRWIRTSHYEG
jgi:hypothetical protein